ncbi:radical SAM/SPASM domain-containing protein [Gorillibacterium timonense]|uniref:radical SAM/SPASM domain-containing protein n=1 Tax=Gorillibacterium timonense TaxID=1689269 RepID=UPI00071DFBA1|nr:radical SAM protein [Gorillibacterium timonense]
MLNLTRLLTGISADGDSLRYSPHAAQTKHGVSSGRGPVVVWNVTRACNLNCLHCYSNATASGDADELSHEEALAFIDDLAAFHVPVLLFSGGEPLLREDLFTLIEYAAARGIRPVVSSNGTLITEETAHRLQRAGTGYVGISLDGSEVGNDRFRGAPGAYRGALAGIRHCLSAGQKVGLRFTLSRHTYEDLDSILRLIEEERIPRACFYHLVYTGRGQHLREEDITRQEARDAVLRLIKAVLDFQRRGVGTEILTVDNHADSILFYHYIKENHPETADTVLALLQNNGGNRSGVAFGCVDWHGHVYPDQFTRDRSLGTIRERPFSAIWTDPDEPLLASLRNRGSLLKGRCGECGWLNLCNGNFRARATAEGDFWSEDPSCYLTDEEIRPDNRLFAGVPRPC